MTTVHIWAPKVSLLELACADQRFTGSQADNGWWTIICEPLHHGVDYAFYLDGQGPYPDPRSLWQPQGVHGPSRWLDHSRFKWQDQHWRPPVFASAILYELHVGTFTAEGTFSAAIERLDHLVELGVTHVELLPVAAFSGQHGWGYDGVDLYAPHQAYGRPKELKQLVAACHKRGLAVILDVVYNHLGPSGNYLSCYGPYFTNRYVTPWGEAMNLDDAGSHEVRRFLIDNALMWLRDYHVDGLRLDAVHAMIDSSALHFLEQLASEVKTLQATLGRELVLIAESDLNDPRLIRPTVRGGYALHCQWNEDFHHALHAALTGERGGYYVDFGELSQLAKVLSQGFAYDGCFSRYRNRHHGRPATATSAHNFVGCLQNHDQIGNRAKGDRTSALLRPGLLKIGAALVLSGPFIPMLFQGEEWAASTPFCYFTDHPEPELAQAVREGRCREFAAFGWPAEAIPDPQDRETFLRSKLKWEEHRHGLHREMLEWHQALINLRRRLPELNEGRFSQIEVAFEEQSRWLLIKRDRVHILCNLSRKDMILPLQEKGALFLLLASDPRISFEAERLYLPAESVALLAAGGPGSANEQLTGVSVPMSCC